MEVKKNRNKFERERERMWRKKRIFIYKTEHERYTFFFFCLSFLLASFSLLFFSSSRCCFFLFHTYTHCEGPRPREGEQEEGFYVVGELGDGEREGAGGGERRRNEKRFRKERKEEGSRRERTSWTRRNSAQEKKTYMRITTPQHSIYLTYIQSTALANRLRRV